MYRNNRLISTEESFRLISFYYQNKLNAGNIEDNDLIKKDIHFLYVDIMRKSGEKDKAIKFLSQMNYSYDVHELPNAIELINTYIYFKDYEGALDKFETFRAKHRYLDKLKIFLFTHINICNGKIVPNDDTYNKIVDMSIECLKEEFDFLLFEFLYNFVTSFWVPIVSTPLILQNESQESGQNDNVQSEFVEFKKIDTEENSCNVSIESKYSQVKSEQMKDFCTENDFKTDIANESTEIYKNKKSKKSSKQKRKKVKIFAKNPAISDDPNQFFWKFIEKLSFMTNPLYFEKLKIEEVKYLATVLNSEILHHRYILLKGFKSEKELFSYFKNKPSHYIFRNAVYFLERFHYPKLFFLTKKAGLLTEEMVLIKNAYKVRHKRIRDLGLAETRKILRRKKCYIKYTGQNKNKKAKKGRLSNKIK
ncbi:hypothetical protein CWI37_1990p0020 [Hamiltosporidium tvaerminnensis]|uniref:Uncharacterized protein n=1 Tax=Hamiltosporidium tvaerminnensis TaxID=1176355 RepID=A0A4Q9KUI8_9MICR|nr:hypothetical protein LUQ84_001037 [Hamiltosporidium tvaerminnensis]TBT97930.1 hypothetical protein CWI37_1990p0020 [Hamiltosporidium tvaerminnensis]